MKLTRQLLSIAFALLCSAALASAVPGRAEVKKIVGTATLINATGASSSLAAGLALGSGDTISTGPSSTVDLDLGLNGDVLRVEPDSTVKLDQLDISNVRSPIVNTKLNVTKGGVTANVITKLAAASRYEVRTPNGVAGIRGTIYHASVGTGMNVLHGAVSWTRTGGVVVNLSMGQSANQNSVPSAIGGAIRDQVVASVAQATGATRTGPQLANTLNTLAQSVATTAAIAVLAGGGTQAQAAAAAASAAQQVTTQVVAALTTAFPNTQIAAQASAGAVQTAVAAAAVGAAVAVASSGGTAEQAQAAAATAAGSAAAATGGTVTTAITAVANTAATATAAAVVGGATGAAAASAIVTSSAVTTTQTVVTAGGSGGGAPVVATATAIENPLTVSAAGGN